MFVGGLQGFQDNPDSSISAGQRRWGLSGLSEHFNQTAANELNDLMV